MKNLIVASSFLLLVPLMARADETQQFIDVVQPLLQAKCVACHGPEKQEGGLRLDSREAARKGGDTGPAVVPGEIAKSLLVEAVRFTNADLQMPPKQKLTDAEIETLTHWVAQGAAWPDPATVLFEDESQFLAALTSGNGKLRLVKEEPFAGTASLGVTPLQRDAVKIPGWSFVVREKPQPGEVRFLRLAWKKQGGGSVMVELASSGAWPDAKSPRGRYVAGPNTTGWAAISVGELAPAEWTVATFDLWKDLGDMILTGIAPTCDGGQEAFFDSLILGPTIASLDAYRPGFGQPGTPGPTGVPGDAFTDKNNPVRKLFRGERLDLWSLKKPQRPELPAVKNKTWERTPVDRFLLARLEARGIAPAPQADRRTLIRRLTFDLTGLPPTGEEVQAFAADESPDAYDQLVERLLKSPRYGERWARHWLDVVRYADTHGYERDEFRPLAWQYRDYVIRAFNQDKPFDQFIREQLAGDELVSGPPKSLAEADMLIATGYLRLGQWDSTASIFQEEPRLRNEQMADLVNTTSAAFLGLTMSCCQCHDHKYDPLLQADHYRMRAFFAAVQPRDDLAIDLADEQNAIAAHNATLEAEAEPLRKAKAALDADKAKPEKAKQEELAKGIAAIEAKKRRPRAAMGAADSGSSAPATHVFYQGDFSSPRDEAPPGFVSVLFPGPAKIEPPRENTTGRRLALANWIAANDNPWTARVLVNRVWQQHFGGGLVATANDFGTVGARPTHPELLDWLAVEFMDRGWSIKELHRVIVKSAAYRQSSRTDVKQLPAADPDNTLLWRQNVQRLDAETLRDSLLAVSGLLLPNDSGKPLWPQVPEELLDAQPAILEAKKGGDGGRMQGWYTDPVEQADVRSVFLVRKRCLPIPFLQAFDLPDSTVSCARRGTTVVAPQALMLLNSPEGIRFAQALSDRVFKEADNTGQRQVDVAFRRTLGRSPDAEELKLSLSLLARHAEQHRAAGDRATALALTDLCRALLNLNEFSYVD